jgi:hypothetical protein
MSVKEQVLEIIKEQVLEIIKEQVLEIIKESYKTMYGQVLRHGKTTYASFVKEIIEKIQDIPDEVTLREVKEFCKKRFDCLAGTEKEGQCDLDCNLRWDNDFCECTPHEWDIDKITKAVRG